MYNDMPAILRSTALEHLDKDRKPKNALTNDEIDALIKMMCTGEREKSSIPMIQTIGDSNPNYQRFLEDIQRYTLQQTANCSATDKDVIWKVVGVEFRKDEVEKQYGAEVYEKVSAEVPSMAIKGSKMQERSFSGAQRKLGCLIQEGLSASGIMDLDQLVELLKQKGIPSYFDFETNTYHYNAREKVKAL